MGKQVDAGFHYGGVAQLGEHLPCKRRSWFESLSPFAESNFFTSHHELEFIER